MSNRGINSDIELLRCVAISITVVAHLGTIIPEWVAWTAYFWLGGGVDLFFAVSGFLITGSLLASPNYGSLKRFIGAFLVRRAFRLWPAALFWSSATVVYASVFNAHGTFGPQADLVRDWLFGALNVQNLHIWACATTTDPCQPSAIWHYWSLSLEEQFYFVLPLVLFFVRGRRTLIVVFLAAAIAQVLSYRPWGTLLWFARTDALLFGSCVGLAWDVYGERIKHWPIWDSRGAIMTAALASLVCLVLLSKPAMSQYYMGFVSISAGVAVFLVSADRRYLTSNAQVRSIAGYIGSRSYSIYLVHLPVLSAVREFSLGADVLSETHGQIVLTIVALALTVLLADLSYRFIENPLRKRGTLLAREYSVKATA
jgi:peptidoglycan/LPS O-acetylase OafA/YrhL